jgi:hypothetical protein
MSAVLRREYLGSGDITRRDTYAVFRVLPYYPK